MFSIEHRQGSSVLQRETSRADRLEDAITEARAHALTFGADAVRITDEQGREVGVYPVEPQTDA